MASSNETDRGPASGDATGRVLVVDDEPTVSEVVAECLERAGSTVQRAAAGTSATCPR
ncbi:hypothetical protein [Streptomyces sp. NPDC060031]|uniref:hypothetical protein n=1 Tax=Streptomyces sp. NPDC060031 TaxID=3347043 RepID=UPI00368ECE3A